MRFWAIPNPSPIGEDGRGHRTLLEMSKRFIDSFTPSPSLWEGRSGLVFEGLRKLRLSLAQTWTFKP